MWEWVCQSVFPIAFSGFKYLFEHLGYKTAVIVTRFCFWYFANRFGRERNKFVIHEESLNTQIYAWLELDSFPSFMNTHIFMKRKQKDCIAMLQYGIYFLIFVYILSSDRSDGFLKNFFLQHWKLIFISLVFSLTSLLAWSSLGRQVYSVWGRKVKANILEVNANNL